MNELHIQSTQLYLRILDERDRDSLFSYRSLPEVGRFQSWKPQTLEEVDDFIHKNMQTRFNEADTWIQLTICLPEGRMIGDLGVHFLWDEQVELGYTLSPEFQGRGLATEAVKAVMNYLFRELCKHRITASIDPDNLASARLLERIGFRKEAHFVKSYFMDGRWYDDCVYAMLSDEWNQRLHAGKDM